MEAIDLMGLISTLLARSQSANSLGHPSYYCQATKSWATLWRNWHIIFQFQIHNHVNQQTYFLNIFLHSTESRFPYGWSREVFQLKENDCCSSVFIWSFRYWPLPACYISMMQRHILSYVGMKSWGRSLWKKWK